MVIIIWYPASPSRIIVFIIEKAITNCYKIKKEKKRERNSEIKGNKNQSSRSHDWLKKAPKPFEVLQRRFFAELNESMKLLRSERTSTSRFGKKSSNYGLWNVVRVCFFLKNCCNRRSKRIEAVRYHRYGCGSSNERVCNRSVLTTLTTEPSCVCLIELKTGLVF